MRNFVKSLIVTSVVIIATISFIVTVQKHKELDVDSKVIISLEDMYVEPLANSKQPVPQFAS